MLVTGSRSATGRSDIDMVQEREVRQNNLSGIFRCHEMINN